MTPGVTSLEGTPPESATTDTENFAASLNGVHLV